MAIKPFEKFYSPHGSALGLINIHQDRLPRVINDCPYVYVMFVKSCING